MARVLTLTRTWHGNHLSDCYSPFSLLDSLIRRFSVNGFYLAMLNQYLLRIFRHEVSKKVRNFLHVMPVLLSSWWKGKNAIGFTLPLIALTER